MTTDTLEDDEPEADQLDIEARRRARPHTIVTLDLGPEFPSFRGTLGLAVSYLGTLSRQYDVGSAAAAEIDEIRATLRGFRNGCRIRSEQGPPCTP